MIESPLADVVSRQYERWTYPAPIEDLAQWTRDFHEFFDPSYAHRMLWPDRPYKPDLDILIAGCGTNQASVFAYRNPQARVLGVDISEASLSHQRYLKSKHDLANLELRRLPIEELATLGRDFDLIVSTGVLHHMADPAVGMRSLAQCLRPDGAIALMLYARYGRLGVEVMQSVFRDLGLKQNERSLALVRNTLEMLPATHPVRPYMQFAPDLSYDAGLVDTFLHGRDRSYTVEDCLELVTSAGLAFQGWINNECYYPETIIGFDSVTYAALADVPEETLWSVVDRLIARNGCHYFVACRPERPRERYAIEFPRVGFLDYVPALRHPTRINADSIERNGWRVPLNPSQVALLREIDGQRSIGEIVERYRIGVAHGVVPDLRTYAYNLFRSVWRLGYLTIGLERMLGRA